MSCLATGADKYGHSLNSSRATHGLNLGAEAQNEVWPLFFCLFGPALHSSVATVTFVGV